MIIPMKVIWSPLAIDRASEIAEYISLDNPTAANKRKEARKMGLDPNVWFRNVEVVAAKRIGRETVQYVSNIYKYFVVYSLLAEKGKL